MTKRWMALLTALVMVFALTACGGSGSEAAADQSAASAQGGEEEGGVSSGPLTAGQEEQKEQLRQVFTRGAQGRGSDGFDYFLAYNDDVSRACLLKADHDNQQCVDVTGEVSEDEEEWLTITDSAYGCAFRFALKDETDTGITMVTTNDVEVELVFVDADRVLTNIVGYESRYTVIDPTE